jgi:hypothetical protein
MTTNLHVEPRTASGSTAIDRWIVSVPHVSHRLASQANKRTIIILPEIDKRPIKPNLQPVLFVYFLARRNDAILRHGLTWFRIELIRLNGLEPWIFSQACHARDKLIRSDSRMEDGI